MNETKGVCDPLLDILDRVQSPFFALLISRKRHPFPAFRESERTPQGNKTKGNMSLGALAALRRASGRFRARRRTQDVRYGTMDTVANCVALFRDGWQDKICSLLKEY